MKVIAIDPGDELSAAVVIDCMTGMPLAKLQAKNGLVKTWIREQAKPRDVGEVTLLVIEYTPPYTMSMGNGRSFVPSQVVDTAIEIGRFVEFWSSFSDSEARLLSRIEVKKELLGKTTGTDAMVRAALMNRWGGEKRAVGAVKCLTCKGRGTNGFVLDRCPECDGRLQVPGKRPGTKKFCPRCKAKGVVKGDRATCEACKGSKWEHKPGPMHGITADLYAALAVGLVYCDRHKLIQVW